MKQPKIYQGDVTITKDNAADWETRLRGVAGISGDLYIHANARLDAPALKTVSGDLYIHANARLDAPALKTVSGDLYIHANANLDAPALKQRRG